MGVKMHNQKCRKCGGRVDVIEEELGSKKYVRFVCRKDHCGWESELRRLK